jgi:hypothetical protein
MAPEIRSHFVGADSTRFLKKADDAGVRSKIRTLKIVPHKLK